MTSLKLKQSHIDGSKELQAILRQLPAQLQKNANRATAKAGAEVIQRFAYGELARSMRSRSPREEDVLLRQGRVRRSDTAAMFEVGPPKWKPQLRWLHDGTQQHWIHAFTRIRTSSSGGHTPGFKPRKDAKKVLASKETVYGRRVLHPGQPPRPWLFAASWKGREKAYKAAGEKFRTALIKQANRLASKHYGAKLKKRIRGRVFS